MTQPLRPTLTAAYQLWFKGLGGNPLPPEPILKRWWGFGKTKEEGLAFDQHCSDLFSDTLKSISPRPIESKSEAESISKRLLESCQQEDSGERYESTLGLIILLDQMPRHIYRDDRASIAYLHFDPIAQAVAKDALDRKVDTLRNHNISPYRQWFYMPLVHSEDVRQHEIVAQYYASPEMTTGQSADAQYYLRMGSKSAVKHFDIIKMFGRYPHRNACLRRQSTPQEEKWLAEGGTYH